MKKTLYFAICATFVLAACNKEDVAPVNNEPENITTIYASFDEVKSTVDADAVFSWISGETVSVGTSEGYKPFNCTNTSTGEFTGTGTPVGVAVSPAQSGTFTSASSFQVSYPASYSYVAGTTNALMVGSHLGDNKYKFSHVGALLAVTYENVPAGTKGFTLTAAENITGTVTLTGTNTSAIEIANGNTSLNGKSVTVNLDDATVGNTASMTFYVPLPTGTYTSLSVKLINDNSDLEASTVKTVKNVSLNRGDYLALPAIPLVEGFVPTTVGKSDNSSAWETAWSNLMTIEKGKVLHMEFVNHGSKVNNWNNWILFITNNKPYIADKETRTASGYSEYFVLRCDNYGWGTDYTPNRLSSNYNWVTFKDDMDGATVTMTIEYTTLGSIIVKTKTDNGYYENYSHPISIADGSIGAFLWCDNSHYDIKKVWYSNSKKTSISSLKSAYDLYVFDTALNLDIIGWPKDVAAVFNDGEEGRIHASAVAFPTGSTLAPTAGDQNFSAKYNGNDYIFTIPVIKGSDAFGSTSLTTTEWAWGPYVDTILTTPVSWTMFVYSKATDNYMSPCLRVSGQDFRNYGYFRMDNWGWWEKIDGESDATWDAGDFNSNNRSIERSCDWVWEGYASNLNHCTVTVSLSYSSTATVNFAATYFDGTSHNQTFTNIPILASETLLAGGLFTEQSYAVVY